MALYAVSLIELPKSDAKWVARLWNVSEERDPKWSVAHVSSVIGFASSLLGRVEVKSVDFDHNSHCFLAEREGYSETTPFNARSSDFQRVP